MSSLHVLAQQRRGNTTNISSNYQFYLLISLAMDELWKEVKGYEGQYKISNKGRVFSYYKNAVRSCSIMDGYYKITLVDKSLRRKLVAVHRLVAEHFVPNPQNLPEVNHINEVKTDNQSNNLQWCTSGDNTRHSQKNKARSIILVKNVCGCNIEILYRDECIRRYFNGSNVLHTYLSHPHLYKRKYYFKQIG